MHKDSLINDLFSALDAAAEKAKGAVTKGAKHSSPNRKPPFAVTLAITPAIKKKTQSPNSCRSRRVWARLTGISVCFLSSMRSW